MYNKYIEVNDSFKPSINLNYDLDNESKILEFVPTSDLCDVIKQYILGALGEKVNRATLLAGPYGKGKSYLVLVVSYLLGKRKNKAVLMQLLDKILKIDPELVELINRLEKEKICLLPVVINNNDSSDLTQNFMLALNNSLNTYGISGLVPHTAYTEAQNIIQGWKTRENFDILKECKKALKLDLNDIENGLKDSNKESYNDFCDLFKCVTHGYSFNPLVTDDIGQIYSDVVFNLEKYGFKGMFVVYDEFGIMLENQDNDFSKRLHRIQSFAEKSVSSEIEKPLMFSCVIHKDISLYSSDKKYLDEFAKIAGRFKQLRFDRSLEENYQIICGALKKKNGFSEFFKANYDSDFLSRINETPIFDSNNIVEYVYENGFPFNPITIYALIQLSEKIAQNERTLFTYISDNDRDAFKFFISNKDSGLLNVDSLYDYFSNQIKDSNEYSGIYHKSETLLRTTADEEKMKIIKVIAIMKIINDDIKFIPNVVNLSLSLNADLAQIQLIINEMISENLVKQNINNKSIDFVSIIDESMNSIIERMVNTSLSSKQRLSQLLDSLDMNKYYKSNKYNFEKLMTRFYKSVYLESSIFKKINSLEQYDDNYDGLIVNIINDDNSSLKDLKRKNNEIIRFNAEDIYEDIVIKIHKHNAIDKILSNNNNLSDTTIEALKITKEDLHFEIQTYLNNRNNSAIIMAETEYKDIHDAIYSSLCSTYSDMVVLNNELVNKHEISSVIGKARNNVVDLLLENSDKEYKPTSPEGTINVSFEDALNNMRDTHIIDNMKSIILENKKIKCDSLVNYLVSAPIGMRKGVVPLFIAYVLNSLKMNNGIENNILLYSGKTEVNLNAVNIAKLVDSPETHFISCTTIDKQSLEVVNDLCDLLKLEKGTIFIQNVNNIASALKRLVAGLDLIIIKSTKKENLLNLSSGALGFKDLLLKRDLNNFELLFNILPIKLNVDLKDLAKMIGGIINEYEVKKENYESNIIKYTFEVFNANTETIRESYHVWKGQNGHIKNIHFDSPYKEVFLCLESISNDNFDAIRSLSYAAIGSTLDDFDSSKELRFKNELENFKQVVENQKHDVLPDKDEITYDPNYQVSLPGKTLESNLNAIVREYGEAVSNKEKAHILKKILSQL